MKKTRNNKAFWLVLILSFVLSFSLFMPASIVNVKAGTMEETPKSVQTIIDNTTFVTFRKGDENSRYGRNIFACFYVPNTVYESTYSYGVVLFPKDYGERLGLTSDYFKKAEEQNIVIMDIPATSGLDAKDGKIYKCGIAQILDQNIERKFSFIFYVKDTEGNIAYSTPQFAAWATLDAEEYTDAEVIAMVDGRVTYESSFKQIVAKITELVNSFWIYIVIGCASVVVVWCAFIGVKIAVAKRKEEQINARGMVKNLIIGIVIASVIAVAVPLLMNGLSSWLAW